MSTRLLASALGYYLRHTRAHPGRWRIEAAAMRRSGALKGHLRPTIVQTAHGFRMLVDGNSQAGRVLYLTGRYEPEIASLIERFVRPGDLMIDGGAHIGFFTLLGSSLVGPTGRVMAFEPSRATREILRRNVNLNGSTNVTVVPAALGQASGTAVLAQASASETGQATVRAIEDAAWSDTIDVVALDDRLVDEPRRVALLKLDLEGAELQALLGMPRLLSTHRPAVIVEVTDLFLKQTGGSAAALYRCLTGYGYAAHVVRWDGVHRVESEDGFLECGEQFNALFTGSPLA